MTETPSETKSSFKWRHPSEVMQLHQLKKKKRALQARINTAGVCLKQPDSQEESTPFSSILSSAKRKNPFVRSGDDKRLKAEPFNLETWSGDQTLFKLLHISNSVKVEPKNVVTTFTNILSRVDEPIIKSEIKKIGEKWVPIDWALKTKVRFLSSKPFAWNQKLKLSEEASGITSFTRCLDTSSTTTSLDTSPNSKFHQCCLYWQQPSLPWISLYPRTLGKTSTSISMTSAIRESLLSAWTDSLRSLFQLIRTKQCPYFYVCANNFTVLFRAAGICGFAEMHALVTPTTRGFRHSLKQEEIEFTMPLKRKGYADADPSDGSKCETANDELADEDEAPDEEWLESLGINSEDIKQLNYTQARIEQKAESEVDNSDESLIYIEGPEVQALYSFLVHCKSAVAATGAYAGIPPTLLAPVAYNGATLMSLKVRESKVHMDNEDFYSLDLTGPILPHAIHNLCAIHPSDNSMTATFSTYNPTLSLSKINRSMCETTETKESSCSVFRKENLSDCGLRPDILKHFCSDGPNIVTNIECLKYSAENNSYAWT